ncbi:MAG: ferritin-like domain-containing protein [Cohaesibacter sp.]|nr:ferritin-like domain-containing protein [Cohaesibacter sp.]
MLTHPYLQTAPIRTHGRTHGRTDSPTYPCLASYARAITSTPDLDEKIQLSYDAARAWYGRTLSLSSQHNQAMPDRPGRPKEPKLLPPNQMPKRSKGKGQGKLALLHSLAHIELNAIDLTWDLVGRYINQKMPRSFFDQFVQVGLEEARHFDLLNTHLKKLGSYYGALPAHDGLWQAAQDTSYDLLARLALIPLVLEARGLDVTPSTILKMRQHGDEDSANILQIIYRDEKRHVAFGVKWFRYMCDRQRLAPEPTFHKLVRTHFRGSLKPPFNDLARAEAGLTPGFYKPLTGISSTRPDPL